MWYTGSQPVQKFEDYNSIVKELSGSLSETEAKLTLTKFLKTNLAFTFEMISGVRLLPIQELVIKSILLRDNNLIIAGRGASKSFLISVLSIICSIFYPDTKNCLVSANFRGSRRILDETEKMVKHKKAELLRQCFPNALRRSTDMYKWDLPNGSQIFALPLSGEGLRGTRANNLFIDEALRVSKEIQETILQPFLSVKHNLREQMEIRETEDELISRGLITDKDRISFPKNKYSMFSSASYDFEYLHKVFQDYIKYTEKPPKTEDNEPPPTYSVIRFSYEALPKDSLFDMGQIESAKANYGEDSDSFKREYKAIFSTGNDGYFNVQKLHTCTVKNGDFPTTQLKGEKDAEYILTIDPSYGENKTNDFFAMGVYLLSPEQRKIFQVNTYGKAGFELKSHYEYLIYVLTNFNIVWVTIDASGDEFIKGFNESTLAQEYGIQLQFLDCDFDKEDTYIQELNKAKREHNLTSKKIVYRQKFGGGGSQAIRKMHEYLQNQIMAEKIWFASSCESNEQLLKKILDKKINLPFKFTNSNGDKIDIMEFIADQDHWIEETKKQTALIEVKSSSTGNLSYDLPQSLRRSTDPNRPRKDNFTCLLLAAYSAKIYYDMIFTVEEQQDTFFEPRLI